MRINPHMTGVRSRSRVPKSSQEAAPSENQEQVTKLRETATELAQENLALREEIQRLREKKETPTNLEFSDNVYWLLTDRERMGPFCPQCYTADQRLATLLDGSRFVGKTRWICSLCNRVFDSDA